jgi:hypothetical protein
VYGFTRRGAISVAIDTVVLEERAIGHGSHEIWRLEEFAGTGHDERWNSLQLSAPILGGTGDTAQNADLPQCSSTPPISTSWVS